MNSVLAAPAPLWMQGKTEPSANKGKSGSYHCKTSHKGYNYWLYIPNSYSDDNPAGLHIFFHGQGSSGGAKSFWSWKDRFCEKNEV